MSIVEELVAEARSRWSQPAEFRNYVKENLSRAHLVALQVSDLDRQVRNAGFGQWYYNGYSIDLEDLIKKCQEIGTKTCIKVKILLEYIREEINSSRRSEIMKLLKDNDFGNYVEVVDNILTNKLLDSLDRYNQDYYNIKCDFLSDVEGYLQI